MDENFYKILYLLNDDGNGYHKHRACRKIARIVIDEFGYNLDLYNYMMDFTSKYKVNIDIIATYINNYEEKYKEKIINSITYILKDNLDNDELIEIARNLLYYE